MNNDFPRQPTTLQEIIDQEILNLAIKHGLEPVDVTRLLTDWAAWQNENSSWVYVNRN